MPLDPARHPGIWVSNGYGYVFDFGPERVRAFHLAGSICVEEPDLGDSILPHVDRARREANGMNLVLWNTFDLYEYKFRRLDALPRACDPPTPTTAAATFEALAAYFSAHYAFFDLYGVDWATRVKEVRARLPADADEPTLFGLLRELMAPLRDSHIKLEADVGDAHWVHDGNPGRTGFALEAWAKRRGIANADAVAQFRRSYWLDDIQRELLRESGTMAANGRIQYGMVAEDVGYLAVASMGGYISGDIDYALELAALDAAMDAALSLFETRGARAVIVDVSLNIGGYDFIARSLAGRFAKARTLAYTMRPSDAPGTQPFPIEVQPALGRRFTGAVYLLTSDLTSSAGETLVLCLRTQRHVHHVGETTRGGFSTVLSKPLPNGWRLSLSNEVFADHRGEVWEGRGIPPQTRIPVFGSDDPTLGHVAAVRSVLHMIGD